MKQKAIKSITFIIFTGLVFAFVFYRSGVLGDYIQLSSAGSILNTDTIIKSDTSQKTTIMSSSKVLILKEDDRFMKIDSTSANTSDSAILKSLKLMGGSKSMMIFEPEISVDSTKKEKQK